ncbi:MAG: hypothetical protein RLZZ383_2351 [Pseudomonadota bacterium]|jgi:hypothetical protein
MNASDWLRKRLRTPKGCVWVPVTLALAFTAYLLAT